MAYTSSMLVGTWSSYLVLHQPSQDLWVHVHDFVDVLICLKNDFH